MEIAGIAEFVILGRIPILLSLTLFPATIRTFWGLGSAEPNRGKTDRQIDKSSLESIVDKYGKIKKACLTNKDYLRHWLRLMAERHTASKYLCQDSMLIVDRCSSRVAFLSTDDHHRDTIRLATAFICRSGQFIHLIEGERCCDGGGGECRASA